MSALYDQPTAFAMLLVSKRLGLGLHRDVIECIDEKVECAELTSYLLEEEIHEKADIMRIFDPFYVAPDIKESTPVSELTAIRETLKADLKKLFSIYRAVKSIREQENSMRIKYGVHNIPRNLSNVHPAELNEIIRANNHELEFMRVEQQEARAEEAQFNYELQRNLNNADDY